MRYHELGTTGIEVSRLGMGTTSFMNIFARRGADEAARVLAHGLDAGITLIDTAPSYGPAEEMAGRVLRGRRDEVVLATKVGCYAPEEFDFAPARIRSGLTESLRRLGTDHVDVLYVHDMEYGTPAQILDEVLPLLARLRTEGLTRAVGVSGLVLPALDAAVAGGLVDVVQSYCRYGLHDQSLAEPATRWRAGGTGVVLGSPVAMRLLTPQGPPGWHPAHPDLKAAARRASELCAAYGTDLATLAMQYAAGRPELDAVLTGAGDVGHLTANIAAAGTPPPPDLLRIVLDEFARVAVRSWPSGTGGWPETFASPSL